MSIILGSFFLFSFCLFGCEGNPSADPQVNQDVLEIDFQPNKTPTANSSKIQQLYGLLNESMLRKTLSEFSLPKQQSSTISPNVLTVQSSTERLFTSKPFFEFQNADEIFKLEKSKTIPQKLKRELLAEKGSQFSEQLKPSGGSRLAAPNFQDSVSDLLLPNEDNTALKYASQITSFEKEYLGVQTKKKFKEHGGVPLEESIPNQKTILALEYNPQKPAFAGETSGDYFEQLIPSGEPWPAKSHKQKSIIEDIFQEVFTNPTQDMSSIKTPSKSPLDYKFQRPTYASKPGGLSEGNLGQLIPTGKPWPADPPTQNIALEDRLKETTTTVEDSSTQTPPKSPLEYQSQRPPYAGLPGGISGGHLGQLIRPGKPWPADPPTQNITLEDRLKETTTTVEVSSTQTPPKSPLEYQPQRPPYAGSPGGISGGHLGQLVPPGKPWPADRPTQNITLEDRLKETTTTTVEVSSTQTPPKSPLEYQPQRPPYAGSPGGISGGHLGQLIHPGKPWPADPPTENITLEDRLKETTTTTVEVSSTQTPPKSPLEYQPQRPTFAGLPGGISGGHLGQLIPPGKPWPTGPLTQNISLEDRLKETTTSTVEVSSTQRPHKSPLEYQPQRPPYAGSPGGISGGHLGQLIPPGKPWPADPPTQNITLEDRLKETSTTTVEVSSTQTPPKSPLEYQPQRPTFAGLPSGGISGGHLGQLIPPDKPWPTDPSTQNMSLEDRLKETTTSTVEVSSTQKPPKSPLEYQPQRPTFAGLPGGISGGHLGQLIPPGKPWPADPPTENITLEDRLKETTTTTVEVSSTQTPPKSPLEYQPQRPTFAGLPGGISGGHLGQLIPPGKPWPTGSLTQNISLEDRLKETTTSTVEVSSTQKPPKSPLEYQPQRPPYAGSPGGISGGHLGQLIPPGKPWPADPPTENITLEDRLKETTTTTVEVSSTQTPPKSPLEYQPQRPTFAGLPGGISGDHLGQLIPPGKPWPADPQTQHITLEDRLKDSTTTSVEVSPTQTPQESPLEYQPQRPTFAGLPGGISGGHLGQLIPPGKPWPADPTTQNPVPRDF